MKVLILHPNFPAQFRERARWLVDAGHEVTFLCQTHYGRKIAGVNRVTLKDGLGHAQLKASSGSSYEEAIYRSAQYGVALKRLQVKGFTPDVVLTHTGWGCGTMLADLWPQAHKVGYIEWWFGESTSLHKFNEGCRWPVFKKARDFGKSGNARRNQLMLQEIENCDTLVCPTYWQRAQLPPTIQRRCKVIPDGIDTKLYCGGATDAKINTSYKCLTYGTRGMEVVRGFPEFITELPAALARFPNLKVQIAGEDEINYGGKAPTEGSWGRWARLYLKQHSLEERVEFIGRLAPRDYIQWLRKSWCHVYLTQPYVTSWSLLEAMASGCRMIASDVESVREFMTDREGILIDHRSEGWLTESISILDGMGDGGASMGYNAIARVSGYANELANVLWQSELCH